MVIVKFQVLGLNSVYGNHTDITVITRSSADADNRLDAFVGQSRSTNILGPFQVK